MRALRTGVDRILKYAFDLARRRIAEGPDVAGPLVLVRRPPAVACPLGVSGRGLFLIETLTDVWGVEARGGGKCVWSEFVVAKASDPA